MYGFDAFQVCRQGIEAEYEWSRFQFRRAGMGARRGALVRGQGRLCDLLHGQPKSHFVAGRHSPQRPTTARHGPNSIWATGPGS